MNLAGKLIDTQGLDTQDPKTTNIKIREVVSPDDLDKIFEFRYKVYIDEMSRRQKWADFNKKTVTEPLDLTAVIIGAFLEGEVIGTCRLNFSDNCRFEYRNLYSFDLLEEKYGPQTMYVTKTMVAKKWRRTRLFSSVAAAGFREGLRRGAKITVIDCNDPLVSMFLALGFVPYKGKVQHPEYGSVTPMLLEMWNEKYLRKIDSPLLPHLLSHIHEQGSRVPITNSKEAVR